MRHTDDTMTDSGPPPKGVRTTPIRRFLAGAEAATEPIVGGMSSALGAALGSMPALPGHRVRQVRRRGRRPLASLPDDFPASRRARPVEVGFRTIEVDDIRGTAVGGGDQRGGDFLPLRPFRGANWRARWQRLRRANDRLVDLPPIDVVKFDGGYWVVDGHNRVALALYSGQVAIDATVVELIPAGGQRTEPIGSLASEIESSRLVRGRVEAEARSDAPRSDDGDADGGDTDPTGN